MLRDIEYKPSYSKGKDDIASSFYIPSMKCAISYDRISGYFSSTIYIIAWDAMKEFVAKQGRIRLICSPLLADDDQEAISRGYEARSNLLIYDAIMREVRHMFASTALSAPCKLLAYLIAENFVDVRIAVVGSDSSAQTRRLFHDKVGIFTDTDHNIVGFRGSMNETYKGLAADGNIESIDVFPNWVDERDKMRAKDAQVQFEELWNNSSAGVTVIEFPEAVRSLLRQEAQDVNLTKLLEEVSQTPTLAEKWCTNKDKKAKRPRQHQVDALEAWVANGRRGILEHATGSGKTYTAMCAIRSALEIGDSVLVLVPSIDLLDQWMLELRENIALPRLQLLLCGGGHNDWKKPGTLRRWTQKHPNRHTIVLSTMDTAVTDSFFNQVTQGDHLMVVADEVHRLGSTKRRRILSINCGSSLGLSATPKRYGDSEGTKVIIDYFDGILQPPFTLLDAIQADVLTKYFYYPMTVYLSSSEQEEWDALTKEISLIVVRMQTADFSHLLDTSYLKMKLIARARIVKNATAKVNAAVETIEHNFRDNQKWIVYCDNQVQLKKVLQTLLEKGYDAYEYYSEMLGDRNQTLIYFESHGGILVSIRCLDEGVDIPSTTHALILASSQNPREFIQRRGRILRKAKDKYYAHLHDIIVLPNHITRINTVQEKALSIVESELARAINFGEMAENPSCIATLKNIAVDYGIDINELREGGFEDGEE